MRTARRCQLKKAGQAEPHTHDWVCYWDDGSGQLEALLARLLNGHPK
jgi:hypothetical protein